MKRDAAALLVAQRLGGSRTDLLDRIYAEFQLLQTSYEGEEFLPWFLERDALMTGHFAPTAPQLAAGETNHSLRLPCPFLRHDEEQGALWFKLASGKWQELNEFRLADIQDNFPQSGFGCPHGYSLMPEVLEIFPAFDKDYDFRFLYYGGEPVLNCNRENEWLKHASDLFVADACVKLSQHITSEQLSAYQSETTRARARLWKFTESRRHSARDYELGGQ